MALSEKSILEFKEILEKTYNVEVTREYAEEAAENLFRFYKILIEFDAREREQEGVVQSDRRPNTPK